MNGGNFSRRTWLGGAFAGGVGAHLLRGSTLGAAPGQATQRLVCIFTPNGVIPDQWVPTGGEEDFQLGRILKPLESHRARMLVVDGLMNTAAWDSSNQNLHNNNHDIGLATFLSGTRTTRVGGESWGGGITLDQFIAERIGGSAPFQSLEFAANTRGPHIQSTLCYSGAGSPLAGMDNPQAAFDRVFGGFSPDNQDQELAAQIRAEQKSVLDHVAGELTTVSARARPSEKRRLEAHLTAIRELEARVGGLSVGECVVPGTPGGVNVNSNTATENMAPVMEGHFELMAAALACGLTNVATLQCGRASDRTIFDQLGAPDGHHQMSHDDGANREILIEINRWYAEQVAAFLDRLAALPDADGRTVLDNTTILWGNELAIGNHNLAHPFPFVVFGDPEGYFRTGRVVRLPHAWKSGYGYAEGRKHNDLLISLCHALGQTDVMSFGDQEYCQGPILELT